MAKFVITCCAAVVTSAAVNTYLNHSLWVIIPITYCVVIITNFWLNVLETLLIIREKNK